MRLLSALVLVLSVAMLPCHGQDAAKPAGKALVIPKPDGIDEATWERLKSEHAARIREFVDVLVEAEKKRIRPDRDTVQDFIHRRHRLRDRLGSQAQATLEQLAKAEQSMLGNYVFLWSEVSPRLTGTIRQVGAGDRNPTLAEVLAAAQPGDVVLLGEGSYAFDARKRRAAKWHDIAFVGRGAGKTTVKFTSYHEFPACQRVRFEGVKIDCGDSSWCDLCDGSLHLRDCHLFNYNSGTGSCAAIGGSDTMLLVEGCTFEGNTGRDAGEGKGAAFGLHGFNVLYVRKTEFVDNREVLRAAFPCTFDDCRARGCERWDIMDYCGPIWLRKNTVTLNDRDGVLDFTFAADDRAVIEFILGERQELDGPATRLVAECALARHLPYWIRLLGHRDDWVRSRAIARFEALTGQKIDRPERRADSVKASAEQVAGWIKDLDSENFTARQTAKKQLEEAAECARAQLEAAAAKGSLEKRTRVAQVLETLDMAALKARFARDQEFTRWMKWYEDNRDRLQWDQKANRYLLTKESLDAGEVPMPQKTDLPRFIKNLTDENARTRLEAARGIGKLGQIKAACAREGIEPLCAALVKEADAGVRAAAATALGQIALDPDGVVTLLIRAVRRDNDDTVQIAAITAIGAFGKEADDAVSVLEQAQAKAQKELADAADDKAAQIAKAKLKALAAALQSVGGK